jgi:hypothetical protein
MEAATSWGAIGEQHRIVVVGVSAREPSTNCITGASGASGLSEMYISEPAARMVGVRTESEFSVTDSPSSIQQILCSQGISAC